MALLIKSPAYPQFFVYATDYSCCALPSDAEREMIVFGVYPEDDAGGEHVLLRELEGRMGIADYLAGQGVQVLSSTVSIDELIIMCSSALMREASQLPT